jgi:predicted dehydrogenase
MRIGVVGYGMGGRFFHTPFIEAAEGCELAGIVTRSEDRRALAAQDLPGVEVFGSLTEMIASGVDAVTISTPPATRRQLVLEAVAAGVHVIADKPFAPTADQARDLIRAADAAGVMLSVFHNRRWDADITTLKSVLDSGALGQVWRLDSRFDLDQADTLELGPAGGLLRDLGSHLVDQALWLLGPAASVYASLDWIDHPAGKTNAGFVITISHDSGAHSHLSASKVNRTESRELRLFGSAGSYTSEQRDVQAQALFSGRRPVNDRSGWGYEEPSHWGRLATTAGIEQVPSRQGAYFRFYEQFAAAADGHSPQPVPAVEALHTVEVLDAALLSAVGQRSISLRGADR